VSSAIQKSPSYRYRPSQSESPTSSVFLEGWSTDPKKSYHWARIWAQRRKKTHSEKLPEKGGSLHSLLTQKLTGNRKGKAEALIAKKWKGTTRRFPTKAPRAATTNKVTHWPIRSLCLVRRDKCFPKPKKKKKTTGRLVPDREKMSTNFKERSGADNQDVKIKGIGVDP